MYFLYSFLYSLAFVLISPIFLLRREKYAAGFRERLGNYPAFQKDSRPVIWLHCVSVGETNAARPLIDKLLAQFPDHLLVFSTTTRTGQELARNIFKGKAAAIFYFPFDWKFSVRRALKNYRPSIVLLMETEIWPRFFRESHRSGAKLAIVNGRLSERSFRRYSRVKGFVRKVLGCVDLALMQGKKDAERIVSLGLDAKKASVTGNLKFDLAFDESETALTEQFRRRFDIDGTRPLIVAASTHDSEERLLMDALEDVGLPFRILFAPRHPERFDTVAALLTKTQYSFARRSNPPAESDKRTDIILLDSIGDLRSVFPLGDIVFVGGSLIPHGGQSILEPASVGRAIIVGPYTSNFAEVIKAFLEHDAIIQTSGPLSDAFKELLADTTKRDAYGKRALDVMNSSLGATDKTIKELQPLLT